MMSKLLTLCIKYIRVFGLNKLWSYWQVVYFLKHRDPNPRPVNNDMEHTKSPTKSKRACVKTRAPLFCKNVNRKLMIFSHTKSYISERNTNKYEQCSTTFSSWVPFKRLSAAVVGPDPAVRALRPPCDVTSTPDTAAVTLPPFFFLLTTCVKNAALRSKSSASEPDESPERFLNNY